MTRLTAPLRDHLRRPVDDVSTRRMWQHIRAAGAAQPAPRTVGGRSRVLLLVAAALALVVALLVVRRHDGPLRLDADRVVLEVDAGEAPLRVAVSDGSAITVSPEARVEVVENDPRAFGTLVARGRARFDVRPGGDRRWTVDCGAFVVEVVGTAFVVERDGTRARVTVERGEVIVRGEAVPGRIARLRAGDDLEVGARGAMTDGMAPAPAPRPAIAADDAPSARPRPVVASAPEAPSARTGAPAGEPATPPASASSGSPAPAATPEVWRDLAGEGRYSEAWSALGDDGSRRQVEGASVDELLALADVARLSGHPREAAAALSRILEQHGGDRRASIAALTLGRLQLDALGQPAAAAASLNRAIAGGLPAGLVEDALARRVEAHARAGDATAALAALDELAHRFPASGRLAPARRWVETDR